MEVKIFTRFVFALTLAVGALGMIQPESALAKRKKKLSAEDFELSFEIKKLKGNGTFLCVLVNNSWTSGTLTRRERFKRDKDKARKLRKKLSVETDPKKKKRLGRKRRAFRQQMKQCSAEGPPYQEEHLTPSPVAKDSFFSGTGIEPIAVAFDVESRVAGETLACELTSTPTNASAEMFDGCTALVRPTDHRVTGSSLQYRARSLTTGKESNVATVTLSWDQDGAFTGDPLSMAHYRDSLTEAEARYLARWANLGGESDELVALATGPGGTDAAANHILTARSCDSVHDEAIALAYDLRIGARDPISQARYYSMYDPSGDPVNTNVYYRGPDSAAGRVLWTFDGVVYYWIHMMRYGCDPFRERFALLLHNHITTDVSAFSSSSTRDHFMFKHLDLLRGKIAEAAGKLFAPYDLVISRMHGIDGSMLVYLDNFLNERPDGNENYARELLELFALGPNDVVTDAPNYSESNVYEISYALMGYDLERFDYDEPGIELAYPQPGEVMELCCDMDEWAGWTFRDSGEPVCVPSNQCKPRYVDYPIFDEDRWNDPTRPRRAFLFEEYPFGTYDVFKADATTADGDNVTPYLMYQHPGVPRFLAARLIASFAGLELTEEMVAPVAAAIVGDQYDFTAALRQIFTSSSYFSEQARNDSIAAPVETFISFVRSFNLPVARVKRYRDDGSYWYSDDVYDALRDAFAASGQYPLQPNSVFGWEEAGKITGNKVHDGQYWLNTQFWLERMKGFNYILNEMDDVAPDVGFSWTAELLPADPALHRDAGAIVDNLVRRLGLQLSTNERDLLIEYTSHAALDSEIDELGFRVPKDGEIAPISLADLDQGEFESFMTLKLPGLLELLFGLRQNHVR